MYGQAVVDELVRRFLAKEARARLVPLLDGCVQTYIDQLDEDGQVDFKKWLSDTIYWVMYDGHAA